MKTGREPWKEPKEQLTGMETPCGSCASACKVRVTERSPSGTTGWGRSVEAEVESSEVGEEKEKRLAPVAAWPLLCSVAVTVVVAPGIREGISGEKERVSTGA